MKHQVFMRKIITLTLAAFTAISFSACALLPQEELFTKAPDYTTVINLTDLMGACMLADVEKTVKVSLEYIPAKKQDLYFGIANVSYGEFFVGVGDSVKAGDVLGKLNTDSIDDKIKTQELSVQENELLIKQNEENRTVALKKTKVQYSDKSSAEVNAELQKVNEKYDTTTVKYQDKIKTAQEKLVELNAELAKYYIYAPFDGTVTYVHSYAMKDKSAMGTKEFTVTDASVSVFRGKSKSWELFPKGLELEVVCGDNTYRAVAVSEEELGIAATEHVEGKEGLLYFKPVDAALTIADGTTGNATLLIEKRENVKTVPNRAIRQVNGKTAVYLFDEKGMRIYREVEIGLVGDTLTEIISGLESGEEVILN